MTFSTEYLQAVVDTLLPGLEAADSARAIPSASSIGLHQKLALHLDNHPDHARLKSALLAIATEAEPYGNFESLSEEKAAQVIVTIEKNTNELFLGLLHLLAADYYEHEVILKAFGWRPSPPQPAGYQLVPMDEILLKQVKKMSPIWRKP